MNDITIYIIDDEPEMVELLSDVVELAGLNVQGYTLASKFFEKVIHYNPGDILLLDLNMPEMDGVEVMRKLSTQQNQPALILISGTDKGLLSAAEKLGKAHNLDIITVLSKPVNIYNLIPLLNRKNITAHTDHLSNYLNPLDSSLTKADLHYAIQNNQLVLYYQPQLEISTGKLTSVEALVRWNHPEQGLIFPDRFIPLAEHSGLIGDLTSWVVNETMYQNQQWLKQNLKMSVSVNISADDVMSLNLPEQITELLNNNSLDPSSLTLEVTESALMGELVTSLDILTRLRLKGIKLSIDDFGTGYSSLSQLHKIPFTELKTDRSFVDKITTDSEARAIVKTCIILGHEINMKVVAEGVEDQQTWELLSNLGCDIAQGYFIAKAMPGDVFVDWVNSRNL
ncbi:MAG: EAL domain-containing response regulator [Gammaproteobacteria bacterium]|jgi:EAL domain-containing protein (putative c-di-GMP-specific phosphodiesterase class I)|nr:EAL domain-containing response regulator [Gammaproteobacteria bacterium]MBT3722054.1 EAL domain-containing response regulator [Gammaproteobacteria bacterium]MBT4078812.1 EAL domain-containing response regulator [Gammaproteobacteria bacterium]MBT4195947.1 EAL domain-containing response regulator [Gammaproteobacteria bacterium]MBT4451581.1 EAL domain-containing response regulator [Gammaproteobacteria bacterium]